MGLRPPEPPPPWPVIGRKKDPTEAEIKETLRKAHAARDWRREWAERHQISDEAIISYQRHERGLG
jgi:hypothetical protein